MIKLLKNRNSGEKKEIAKVRQVQTMESTPGNKGYRTHLGKDPQGKIARLEHCEHNGMSKICT